MSMKFVIATLALWLIAIAATAWVVRETGSFTYLAPVFAVCAIGSVLVVQRARTG
jgi:hypothetical protein